MLTFARPEASIFALEKTNAMKDSIDFGSMEIPKLFRKLLIPTVLGMVFSAVFVITDGIYVGRGIGSDALAAVNITAPLFLISTGVGLMFGVGASVVASIHLAQGKVKAARINVTQAVAVSSLLLAAYSFLITSCAREVALLLGGSERLLPLAVEYMHWFAPFLPFSALLSSGMFFIRLDGSPNYAMLCNAVPAVINIVLDYVFIFILGWGMTGAALATSLGYIVGAGMILGYLGRRRNVVRLCRVKTSRKSMRLTLRNVGYMCRLGLSTFLCEGAIAMMMFAGNYVFIRYLGEDGVATYGVLMYVQFIFVAIDIGYSIGCAPIISYHYGARNHPELRNLLTKGLKVMGILGIVMTIAAISLSGTLANIFVGYDATLCELTRHAFHLFSFAFLLAGFNIFLSSFFTALNNGGVSAAISFLRTLVFQAASVILLPMALDVDGLWWAASAAEALAFVVSIGFLLAMKGKYHYFDET